MSDRNRRIHSVKTELVKKSQEAALAAIQIFNNPLITFKSESFIVLMNIAWTYLLHAYYRKNKIEYRYYEKKLKRKKYGITKKGAHKYWSLEDCLKAPECPLAKPVKDNLLFLIGVRHEIEHQMTDKVDNLMSAKFQACCINYNENIKKLFGNNFSLDKTTSIALQLFTFTEEQFKQLKNKSTMPRNLIEFITDFELGLDTRNDPQYSYRVVYIRDNAANENQADIAYKFLSESSAEGKEIQNILIKNKQYKKLTQKQIIDLVKRKGYSNFTSVNHQNCWRQKWATSEIRNREGSQYGELVIGSQWMWYEEKWLPIVLDYCSKL